ncbi:MAG: hypothetical protein R2784_17185 [Saprospiraceae bacterium]
MDDYCGTLNEDQELFNDAIHFCCEDVGDTVNVILRVYDTEPDAGSVSQNYLVPTNNTNDCMIQVYVEDKVRPICEAPHDVWTTCADIPGNFDYNDTLQLQNQFGNAGGYDNCRLMSRELTPIVNVDICGIGQVRRRFQSIDLSGNTSIGTCQQVIMINPVTSYELDIPGDFEDECTAVVTLTLWFTENLDVT